MQTFILESDNKAAMKVIKAAAKEMKITLTEKTELDDGNNDFYYVNGVRIRKAKGKLDIEKISGSFPNLDIDPKTYRKKLWSRQKV